MNDILDYVVVGHVTHDIQTTAGTDRAAFTVGGTAAYAALTAAALGCRVGVITSAGPDFAASAVQHSNVTLEVIPAPATSTFENHYTEGGRQQRLHALAAPLAAAQVPAAWSAPRIAHIGPIFGECAADLATHFAGSTFLGVTPQGWMRTRDARGNVRPQAWEDAAPWLAAADAVVLSQEDLLANWEQARALARHTRLLVVTSGWQGGTLFYRDTTCRFPAPAVRELDPTGAGDIFATCFFTALAGGAPPQAAATYASCLAARSVTRRGLAAVPQAADITACSRELA